MDELPLDIRSHVDRMLVDTFRNALRNVISAAYDAGYRNGKADRAGDGKPAGVTRAGVARDLFDYEAAVADSDFDSIPW
jgi:hypothetical protein